MKYLINTQHCDPQSKTNRNATPLHLGALKGHLKIVKFLVEDVNCTPTPTEFLGKIPLHYASMNGHLHIVKYFIDAHHVDPLFNDDNKCSPLHSATLYGHLEVMEYFINVHNCDPQVRTAWNATPLHYAAYNGHLDAVKSLVVVHHCDKLCLDDNRQTPLHLAAKFGQLEVVKYLTEVQHCYPEVKTAQNDTPLHYAAYNGHLHTVKFLTDDMKCSADSANLQGETPLHDASKKGYLEAVKHFVESCHCDIRLKTNNGLTAEDLASRHGRRQVQFYLSLVSASFLPASRPADLWRTSQHKFTQLYTWGLKCVNAEQSFASRHTLLIQYLKGKSYTEDLECTLWQKGILMVYKNGTRAVVEVADETCRVYLAMQCLNRHEFNLVEQRSSLISTIKSVIGIIFPGAEIMEFLLPTQSSYRPEIASEIPCTEVARSMLGNSQHVVLSSEGNATRTVSISQLLHFDSLYMLGESVIRNIFENKDSDEIVPESTVKIVCKAVNAHKKLLNHVRLKARKDELSYSQLFTELHKFTIFPAGNLCVS